MTTNGLEKITTIASATDQNINLTPGGTGMVKTTATFQAGSLQVSTATLSSTTTDADITIQPNGNGQIVLDGVIKLKTQAETCDSTQRGMMMFKAEEVAGIGDRVFVCIKKTDGSFGFMKVDLVAAA
jgi:hypothetical protein